MLFSELFHSIQGEGGLAGTPSIFVRTSGCNLRCWFCDTPYTSWEPEQTRRDWQQIVDEVLNIDCEHVVVTGGEPLLQPDVVPLTAALSAAGRHITIETAGTIYRPVHADLISLSPKMTNSTPTAHNHADGARFTERHDTLRDQPHVVRQFVTDYNYQLKFVIDSQDDIAEITAYLTRYPEIDPQHVFLMPQARTTDELHLKADWVEHTAHQHGWNYSPRLHVEWWGDKRGV